MPVVTASLMPVGTGSVICAGDDPPTMPPAARRPGDDALRIPMIGGGQSGGTGERPPVARRTVERGSMDRDRRDEEPQDADWIFATDDPRSLPTERLPSRAEFDRYAAPLLAHRSTPAMPQGENETVDLSDIDPEDLAADAPPRRARGAAAPRPTA